MAEATTAREEELLAELERRFAAVEVPVAASQLLKIAEAWAAVIAAGWHNESALRSVDKLFPEVKALLRAERRELRKTAADQAAVAAWDAAALEASALGLPAPPLPEEVRRAWAYEVWDGASWPKAALEPYGWRESPVDDEGPAMVPQDVYTGLEETLPWCEGDLFNWKFAAGWALNSGWHEAAAWIEDHVGEYLLGVYQGFDVE